MDQSDPANAGAYRRRIRDNSRVIEGFNGCRFSESESRGLISYWAEYVYKCEKKECHSVGIPPRDHRSGFTLIEMMLVVVIIGILAAIAIPSYVSYRERGKLKRAMLELGSIQTALSVLAVDTGMWPHKRPVGDVSGNEVWDLNSPSAGLVATDGGYPGWDGPYLAKVPLDPWGNNYFFDNDYKINQEFFVAIGSFGPNGVGPNNYDADNIIVIIPSD